MKTILMKVPGTILASVGVLALGAAFTSTASASCGTSKPRFAIAQPQQKTAPLNKLRPTDKSTRQTGIGSSVVGLWLVNVTIGGQLAYQAFESFSSDGLETLNDNGSPLVGNVCLGGWTATDGGIKVKHPSWNYDDN